MKRQFTKTERHAKTESPASGHHVTSMTSSPDVSKGSDGCGGMGLGWEAGRGSCDGIIRTGVTVTPSFGGVTPRLWDVTPVGSGLLTPGLP